MLWIASAAFGLEGQTAKDLKRLGIENAKPNSVGGVTFEAEPAAAFEANLWLRCADRVLLQVGSFTAMTFDELFESVRALPWADYIPRGGAFPVRAHCARSQLMSPSDCQSIVKKAIAEKLKAAWGLNWLPEEGAMHAVDLAIHKDTATIALDSSGAALNKRGYRTLNGEAPIRETLAAAMALFSPWRPSMAFYDPCCGTGTLAIEAAMIAADRAPGLTRPFDMEAWHFAPKEDMRRLRDDARAHFEEGRLRPIDVAGSDIDPTAIALARRHVTQAGMEGIIRLSVKDLRDVNLPQGPGALLANPPYGERMGDRRVAQAVAKQLYALKARSLGWSLTAISADMGFERAAGRQADARRNLYNGRLECQLLTFR